MRPANHTRPKPGVRDRVLRVCAAILLLPLQLTACQSGPSSSPVANPIAAPIAAPVAARMAVDSQQSDILNLAYDDLLALDFGVDLGTFVMFLELLNRQPGRAAVLRGVGDETNALGIQARTLVDMSIVELAKANHGKLTR